MPELGADDYSVTGLAEGDSLISLPTLAYEGTPDSTKTGKYAIKASGAAVDETYYTLEYEDGLLTVLKHTESTDSENPDDNFNPDDPDDANVAPQSGDTGHVGVWVFLLALSVIAAVGVFRKKFNH